MPEILLHYIWQQSLFAALPQILTDGRRVEVIHTGVHNPHSGPDFEQVRLRVYPAGELFAEPVDWVGSVEIHLRSSDWYRHRHQQDPAYDDVLLHVVRLADQEVYNSRGERIPQLELQYPQGEDYVSQMIRDARHMDTFMTRLPCSHSLITDPGLISSEWREQLLQKRFECRRQSVIRLLSVTDQSWEDAFYVSLARSFGFHTNSTPFEMLALQTPLSFLRKHRDQLHQVTAMLLGQSGLLKTDDPLYAEYDFLRKKFSLVPLRAEIWKHARMRPQNAPERRIRQFAELIHRSEFLFSALLQSESLEDMKTTLRVSGLGESSLNSLLINTILPYRYAWGMAQSNRDGVRDSFMMMSDLPAEDNTIIRQWKMIGQNVQNAADSQALIHLYQSFCQTEGCLQCEVAYLAFRGLSTSADTRLS